MQVYWEDENQGRAKWRFRISNKIAILTALILFGLFAVYAASWAGKIISQTITEAK